MRTLLYLAQSSLRRPITSLVLLATFVGCVPAVPDPVEMPADPSGPASEQDVRPAVVSITVPVATEGGGVVVQDQDGEFVTLTATPDGEMEFVGWTGTTASVQNPLTILARESTSLTAHFAEPIIDSDLDGVVDQEDDCPDTSRGEPVQETGCSCSQLDDDNDGVTNCDDACPQTASAQDVNDAGCACAQLDADEDGVSDCDDMCAFTDGTDGAIDEHGCGLSQRDSDGDGVNDSKDECPATPEQAVVNSNGCLPVCGDGKVEAGEACDPPDGIDCDDACKSLPPICGNEIVQGREECDPPNGTTCNAFCRSVVFCGDSVVEGGEECDPPNETTCNAVCRLVVFCGDGVVEGSEECDPPNGTTCDDACRAIMGAVCDNGVVEDGEDCDPPDGVTCDENCRIITSAGCGTGSCFTGHTSPGCDDQACCHIICCVLPECCNVAWDETCAEGAALVCQGSPVCNGGTGACQSSHATPGCADEPCCNAVCAIEPACCIGSWSASCVEVAVEAVAQSLGCLCGN